VRFFKVRLDDFQGALCELHFIKDAQFFAKPGMKRVQLAKEIWFKLGNDVLFGYG